MKSKLLIYSLPVLLFVFLFYGYSHQDNPKNKFEDVNTNVDARPSVYQPDNSLALLWDNRNINSTTSGIVSTELRGRNPDSTIAQTADDFIVPPGVTWTIDSLLVRGFYSVGVAPIDSLGIEVFLDSAGKPSANFLHKRVVLPNRRIQGDTLSKTFVSPIVLTEGHYWISTYGVYNTATLLSQGRWNWATGTIANQLEGHLRDKTGIFGLPDASWRTLSSLGVTQPSTYFALYGTESTPSGGQITICRNGINVPIPDNGGWANFARDSIVVSGIPAGMQITKIKVTVDTLLHTWVGDLIGFVRKGNVADTLFSRIGRPVCSPTVGNACDNLIGTNLVDSAGLPNLQNIPCATGTTPCASSGYFNPKDPLAPFQNTGIDPNGAYYFNVADFAGLDIGSIRAWCLTIDYDIMTGVSNNVSIADSYSLSQNFPNPFNPVTKINFSIPKSGLVTLKVFDILGKEVATLVNEVRNAGEHTVDFNALNLPSGAYFYRIEAGDFRAVKKMLLLK